MDPDVLDRLRAAGVDRAIFWLPPATADEVMPILDRGATLVRRLGS